MKRICRADAKPGAILRGSFDMHDHPAVFRPFTLKLGVIGVIMPSIKNRVHPSQRQHHPRTPINHH